VWARIKIFLGEELEQRSRVRDSDWRCFSGCAQRLRSATNGLD
jgi:hypothetical protein